MQTTETEIRHSLWRSFHRPIKKKIIPDLKRDLHHGWLFPYLVGIDNLFWGRWQYWARCQSMPSAALNRWQMEPTLATLSNRQFEPLPKFVIEETLPDESIPQIEWRYHGEALKMLNQSLNCIPEHGDWLTMGNSSYLRYFLDWILFGFGHPAYRQLPAEPSDGKGASMRLYQVLDLSYLLYYPEDYFGRLVPDAFGKRSQQASGFFPTPMVVSRFMAEVVSQEDSKSARVETCNDPCVGTGSLLLTQSNYTLRAIGQDINELLLKCALVQFYLYAPWFAIPIWWLGQSDLLLGNSLSTEKPISMNAQHWNREWLSDDTPNLVSYTIAEKEPTSVLKSTIPTTNSFTHTSEANRKKPKTNPVIQQLSLFDL